MLNKKKIINNLKKKQFHDFILYASHVRSGSNRGMFEPLAMHHIDVLK